MNDRLNCFIEKDLIVSATSSGRLSGKKFAVKDVFSIKDYVCSAGNPDWLRTHKASKQTAPAIQRLLANGATLTGTTLTDELMYSLQGENYHYGTPVNPLAPGRIPGGSSSGSAVAVAGKLVDFALGTDTGGSVRIPSTYCGLFGFRPTHNLVSLDGVIPLAKSFDTVGWMARDPETLLEVGKVLLGGMANDKSFRRLIIAKEAWDGADNETSRELLPVISQLGESVTLTITSNGLSEWANAFRILQGIEIWETHGNWITKEQPCFGPDISSRFQMASQLKKEESQHEQKLRAIITDQLVELLGDDGLLIIPTTPGIAPLLRLSGTENEERRWKTLQLTCIAGLAGLPQVTIPIQGKQQIPIGLSFIAGKKQDVRLLQWLVNQTQ